MDLMLMTKEEMLLAAAALGQLTIEPAKQLAERLKERAEMLPSEGVERNQLFLDLAKDRWHRDGEIEIGDEEIVSMSDNGAYVLAWVWVDDPVEESK